MDKIKNFVISNLAYYLAKFTTPTLRLKVVNEARIDKIKRSGKTIIFAFWHGQLWVPMYYLKDRNYVALASQSQDGEYISRVIVKLGGELVRGSTSKGGARSLLKLIKRLKQGQDLLITPDGPRGPSRELKPGIIYLAQKTDSVIVPVGLAFAKKKVFNSWDSFNLPYPFSKAVWVYGQEINVEKKLSSKELDYYQELIEDEINQAIATADKILGENT